MHRLSPDDCWKVFENTHPAIIDPETWETAQRCRKTVKRADTFGVANPLTGKMFCADCGAKMYNHRKAGGKPNYTNERTGKTYLRTPTDQYLCSSHTNAQYKFRKECTRHHIKTSAVRQIVLDTIKAASALVKTSEAEFVKQIREASEVRQVETAKSHKRRMAKEQKRVAELNKLIRKIYEDNASGRLTDERFDKMYADYEAEQSGLKEKITRLTEKIGTAQEGKENIGYFLELVKQYTDISELTSEIVRVFIDRIYCHQPNGRRGKNREQRIDIYYNYIGLLKE